MRGFALVQTKIWTVSSPEYVFTAGTMFIVNATYGASSTYYTGNLQFNYVPEGRVIWLPAMILEALLCVGLYTFAIRMRTDKMLTVLPFKRFVELEWDITANKDGSVHYYFIIADVLRLDEKTALDEKYARGSERRSTTVEF